MAGYDGLVDRPKPVLRYVVGAALLILLGVLIWILIASNNSKSNKPTTPTPASSSTQTTPPSSTETTPPASSGTSTPSSTPNTPSQPGASAGSTSTPTPTGGAQSGTSSSAQPQLADTGPGETIALFVGVTIIASIIHHRRQAKRQSLSS